MIDADVGGDLVAVFISHASADRAAAEALVGELASRGVPSWIAVHDVPLGSSYAQEIWTAIESCTFVVILLSPDSIVSEHVKREVNLALTQHRQLLPVALAARPIGQDDLGGDWRYWLGVVQIAHAPTISDAAELIARQLPARTAAPPPPATDRTDEPGRGAPVAAGTTTSGHGALVVAPRLEAQIRSALIQTAATGGTFQVALERSRRLGATPAETAAVAEQLRQAQLLEFPGSLDRTTVIRLT